MVKGPQNHSQLQQFSERTHRTQKNSYTHCMVNYSEKIQIKISRETRHKLPGGLYQWSYTDSTWFSQKQYATTQVERC